MAVAVKIENLTKRYPQMVAVNDIAFEVQEGEIFGLLGPNGAGKTTTIEMIEGLRKPDSGTITVLGLDAIAESGRVHELIGVQLQSTTLYDKIKTREALDLFRGYYKRSVSAETLIEAVSLEEIQDRYISKLSGGQQQRVALALALVNDPDVIFLDEPTTGLDPQARRNLWSIIETLRDKGKTIILTTHYMEEAEQLCSRVGIIDHGKIIALDTPRNLINKSELDATVEFTHIGPDATDIFSQIPRVNKVFRDGDRYILHTKDAQAVLRDLTNTAASQTMEISDISTRRGTLEDVFILLTGRKIRD